MLTTIADCAGERHLSLGQQVCRAKQELPDQVDTDRDAGLFDRFGIDVNALIQRFTGGMNLPSF